MALTYEKVPLYKVMKTWEDNDPNLSKVISFRVIILVIKAE